MDGCTAITRDTKILSYIPFYFPFLPIPTKMSYIPFIYDYIARQAIADKLEKEALAAKNSIDTELEAINRIYYATEGKPKGKQGRPMGSKSRVRTFQGTNKEPPTPIRPMAKPGTTVLSKEDIAAILNDRNHHHYTYQVLSIKYGVSVAHIGKIIHNKPVLTIN